MCVGDWSSDVCSSDLEEIMTDKRIKNSLWDSELDIEKRLDFLIENLTLDEKISCMSNANPDIERLGIKAFNIGGEGAHGVQARHDQSWDLSEPDYTTIFPNPIGMSRSWDRELIKKAGKVTGTETRGLFAAGRSGCLSVWADRKSTRLNSSHRHTSRMPSSA